MRTRVYIAKNTAGYDCVVTDWYRKLAKTEQFDIIKQYDTLESYMQDITDDFTDEGYMSEGECLDIAIELFDKGIAYL